jgi:hypothetical protein
MMWRHDARVACVGFNFSINDHRPETHPNFLAQIDVTRDERAKLTAQPAHNKQLSDLHL